MSESASPAVSVVLPVCNAERYVAEAIRSVLAQTFQDFELIVVSDGSTDRSMAICESFTDPRIIIVRQARRGLAGARNTGILHARGRYVALLESDDTWAPEKLALHVAHLDSDEDIGASTSGAMLIDAAGAPLGIRVHPKTGPVTACDVFCGRVVVSPSAPVFRWEMLIESALPEDAEGRHWVFDERLTRSDDIECWTRIAVTSRFRFEAIDQPLTFDRAVPSGIPADVLRRRESWDDAFDRIAHIAPDFVDECGDEARAVTLRSLAQSCVRINERALGLSLVCEAISHWPALLWREPARTVTTVLACLLMRLAPRRKVAQLLVAASPALAGMR
jgi:glycosyltransferase involved in cell wall biosynthesis